MKTAPKTIIGPDIDVKAPFPSSPAPRSTPASRLTACSAMISTTPAAAAIQCATFFGAMWPMADISIAGNSACTSSAVMLLNASRDFAN